MREADSFLRQHSLLSYLILRGRCRSCQGPISPRYFLVEMLTALLSVAIVRNFGPGLESAVYLVFFALSS